MTCCNKVVNLCEIIKMDAHDKQILKQIINCMKHVTALIHSTVQKCVH